MMTGARENDRQVATTEPLQENGVVFVVDDDAEVREYVRWLLASKGLNVQAFDDPQAFLDSLSDGLSGETPACLVTDLRMPGLSGLDLQAEIAARGIELPIIMIS